MICQLQLHCLFCLGNESFSALSPSGLRVLCVELHPMMNDWEALEELCARRSSCVHSLYLQWHLFDISLLRSFSISPVRSEDSSLDLITSTQIQFQSITCSPIPTDYCSASEIQGQNSTGQELLARSIERDFLPREDSTHWSHM